MHGGSGTTRHRRRGVIGPVSCNSASLNQRTRRGHRDRPRRRRAGGGGPPRVDDRGGRLVDLAASLDRCAPTTPSSPQTEALMNAPSHPVAVDRATFEAELERLRVREKAHTREGDAIAAARRRLPMVEVDAKLALIGPDGPVTLIEAFEERRQLIVYYF